MQTISVVARSSGMSFANSVQLWRYMCCVNVFAVSGIGSGSIYSNSNFAESMINLWHLLTPQEMEMLEVLRPNTSYAHKEFCVYCAEVCTNSLQHGELDPRTYDRYVSARAAICARLNKCKERRTSTYAARLTDLLHLVR